MLRGPRLLIASVVDPERHVGGASSVLRGFIRLLESAEIGGRAVCVAPVETASGVDRGRQARSLVRSVFSTLPSKALYLRSRSFERRFAEALDTGEVDGVVLFGGDLLWLLDRLPPTLPRALASQNYEFELFQRQIESLPGPARLFAPLLRGDVKKLRALELDGMRSVHNVIFVSEHEEQRCGELVGELNSIFLPPVFDYEPGAWEPAAGGEVLEVGFLANFTWWPNEVSLRWLCDEVLPRVGRSLRVRLFGVGSREAARLHESLVGHGYVEELDEVWKSCRFMICPIVDGAGVSVKMAEMLYNGARVLATPHACRGLGVEAGPGLAVRETAAEWAEFLDNDDGEALAVEEVPSSVRRLFHVGTQSGRFAEWIRAAGW